MALIEVANLSKSFTYHEKELGLKSSIKNLFKREKLTKEAVSDISFTIEEGEIVGFLGPNGAGKTTTLKMLSGILHPTSGSAKVLGFTPWERKKNFKMQFAIVMGQKSQLWWDLPANESLYLNKCIYEVPDLEYQRIVDELSDLLDVRKVMKVPVRRLSLGERMKFELIASLIHRPKVIFLDEPTIGLDIVSQRKIREFFKYYNEKTKTTIVLTSHYINDIENMCNRTIVINNGKIIYDGNLNKINKVMDQKKILKIRFSDIADREVISKYGIIRQFNGLDVKIEVDKDQVKLIAKTVLEDTSVVDINIEDVPLEEGITLLYEVS